MPYVSKADRQHIGEPLIQGLITAIQSVPSGKRLGATNYVVSRVAVGALKGSGGYTEISQIVAALRDAATEVERRLMGPREDQAIQANGDLPEYKRR